MSKELRMTKTQLAIELGLSRSTLYYQSKIDSKDTKILSSIKEVMDKNPSYGHRRIALALGINHKRALRIMQKFGLQPALKRIRSKYRNNAKPKKVTNLIKNICPIAPNIIWVTDFTHRRFRNKFVYLATVLDLFSRKIIGWNLSFKQDQVLTSKAIEEAFKQGKAEILHSDRGAQYQTKDLEKLLQSKKVKHSQSDKSSPWQNGWQESFYSQFKLELGGTGKYLAIEDLTNAISSQIDYYNNDRIHTKLKTSPLNFLKQYYQKIKGVVLLSEKMGT
jgi:putative transposase